MGSPSTYGNYLILLRYFLTCGIIPTFFPTSKIGAQQVWPLKKLDHDKIPATLRGCFFLERETLGLGELPRFAVFLISLVFSFITAECDCVEIDLRVINETHGYSFFLVGKNPSPTNRWELFSCTSWIQIYNNNGNFGNHFLSEIIF
jgi:hypothetical protein